MAEVIPISRAIARMLATHRERQLTQAEQDCLRLYRDACLLHGQITPDCKELEGTAAYRRGSELSEELYGPVVPYHQDAHALRSNLESLYFERLHAREPADGDVLRRTDWDAYHETELLEIREFIAAWQRQIPELACPLEIKGGRVYQHEKAYRSELPRMFTEWRESNEYTAECWWDRLCDGEANIESVMFLGVIDGRHRSRPAGRPDAEATTAEVSDALQ